MANFYVKTEQLENAATNLMTLNSRLTTFAGDLYSVRRSLDRDITVKGNVENRLEKAFAHSMVQANYLKQFSTKLQEAAALYAKTENGLAGKSIEQTTERSKTTTSDVLDFVNDPRSKNLFNNYRDYQKFLETLDFGEGGLFDAIMILLREGFDPLFSDLYAWVIEKFGGDALGYTEKKMQESLARILGNMTDTGTEYELPGEVNILIRALEQGVDAAKKVIEKYESLKKYVPLLDVLGETTGLALDTGIALGNGIEYIFTEYSKSIEILESLRHCGIQDPLVDGVVDNLIAVYQDKFFGSIQGACDYAYDTATDKAVSTAADWATGGLYSIAELAKDFLMETSGYADRADAVLELCSTSILSDSIQQNYEQAIDVIRSGNYTQEDINTLQNIFELQKAVKIEQYESFKEIIRTEDLNSERLPDAYAGMSREQIIAEIDRQIEEIKTTEMDVFYL